MPGFPVDGHIYCTHYCNILDNLQINHAALLGLAAASPWLLSGHSLHHIMCEGHSIGNNHKHQTEKKQDC